MTTDSPVRTAPGQALRRLYFTRFAFALVWAVVLFFTAGSPSPFLTVWLLIYPLFDAGSVLFQLRSEGRAESSRIPEWLNVVLSVVAAVALAWTSTVSTSSALVAWGAWAIVSGLLQLIVAILRRRTGGQVPLMISGAVSVLAGSGFAMQGIQGGGLGLSAVGGYAILGGILFLISAIRLSILRGRRA